MLGGTRPDSVETSGCQDVAGADRFDEVNAESKEAGCLSVADGKANDKVKLEAEWKARDGWQSQAYENAECKADYCTHQTLATTANKVEQGVGWPSLQAKWQDAKWNRKRGLSKPSL